MSLLSAAIMAVALPSAAAAPAQPQDQGSPSISDSSAGGGPTPGNAKAAHPDTDQAIVVTGVRRAAGDVLGGVSIVDKEQLQHDIRPSIGDTLASLPGVTASSFGPTASRPILRGLQGERVRILVDGIGSLDLSSSDPDHAVAINPLTAERIEVLRGPSALLFGSSAIGGGPAAAIITASDAAAAAHLGGGVVNPYAGEGNPGDPGYVSPEAKEAANAFFFRTPGAIVSYLLFK
jgi:iron complex outermembrane receptor protein